MSLSFARAVYGVATAACLSLAAAQAWAENESVTFTLINSTGVTMVGFFASPPGVSEWEDDILGETVLESGDSTEVTIDDAREDCVYDFLAVFEDESTLEHPAVPVCDGESYEYK
jgi:hypothetical protein